MPHQKAVLGGFHIETSYHLHNHSYVEPTIQ
jgi:hypothetical protein